MREGRLSASDADSFRPHMATCEVCRDRFNADERLRALGLTIEAPSTDEVALRRMRASILKRANGSLVPRAGARWAVLAAALLCIVAGSMWWLRPTPAVPVATSDAFAGTITGDALYERSRAHDVEQVALHDGRIEVHVRHLVKGERFLVTLPDGELEVRGTTFEVVVDSGSTQRVSVTEGWVALRLTGSVEVDLRAGQAWTRPVATAPSATAVLTAPQPAITKDASAPTDPYGEAMMAYRSGDYELAVNRFRRFVASSPDAPEAEDAAYLEAVSLARAGHKDAAASAARAFLEKYPQSFHRKEATLLTAPSSTP